jgi:phthalate 4,5-dioxygenase oxygenase subunit
MLSPEDNDLLCRVSPGTPMGSFMRRFWIPALRSAFLKVDGNPQPVRLLGQNFVAFRDTKGRVGLLNEACPHRGVSLTLARNEGCGLRCIYHGWKFDVDGNVTDVPTEPISRRADFAKKVPLRHYSVREAGGIVWVYLGEAEDVPDFPAFNWLNLPDDHIDSKYSVVPINWLGALESQLDSAHVGILHSDFSHQPAFQVDNMMLDNAPRFEFEDRPYGFREAAIRNMPEGGHYVRVREFVLPWTSYIPMGERDVTHTVTFSVPVDDEHCAEWDIHYNLVRPLIPEDITEPVDDPNNYVMAVGTRENRFNQDRERMNNGSWSGFSSLRTEDFAVNISQGTIPNRSDEYLGSSDIPIVRARRLLADSVRKHIAGEPMAKCGSEQEWNAILAISKVIPAHDDWRDLPRG